MAIKPNHKPPIEQIEAMFLGTILEKAHIMADNLNNQVSILVGVNSALFVFSLSQYLAKQSDIIFLILSFFTGATSLIGLLAVHPPNFMRKRNQPESIMFNKKITSYASPDDYAGILLETMKNREAIFKEYAREIYNVSKYYYQPKRKLFNFARNIFIVGMVVTFLYFLATLI